VGASPQGRVLAQKIPASGFVLSNGLATAAPSEAIQQRSSPLFDYRRLKDRKGWRKPDPEDVDFIVLPRERLGRTYNLNFTICKYAVVPNSAGGAFYNLHSRGLQMFADATLDKNKALHVSVPAEECTFTHHFVLPSPPGPTKDDSPTKDLMFVPEGAKVVDENTGKKISKEVRRFLTDGKYIFVQDGAFGSHPSVDTKIRFMVPDASTALFLKHAIPKQPPVDIKTFEENITIFVAPELKGIANVVGASSESFTLINFSTQQVFVVGTKSPEAIQDALSSLATYLLGTRGVLPMQCDSALSKDGKPVLFFGQSLGPKGPKDLFGTYGHLWSDIGISRMYDGAMTGNPDDFTLKRGDIAFHAKKGTKTTKATLGMPLSQAHNLAPHPAAVVFISPNSKSGPTKISVEEAANQYLSSFQFPVAIKPELMKQRFNLLLAQKKVAAYQVGLANVAELTAQLGLRQ